MTGTLKQYYLTKFQRLVDEYNSGSSNNEKFFEKLVKFSEDLTTEERRHISENLSEEDKLLVEREIFISMVARLIDQKDDIDIDLDDHQTNADVDYH